MSLFKVNYAKALGYFINGLTYSSIKGPSGNIEYLLWLSTKSGSEFKIEPQSVVNEAFEILK